MIHPVPTVRSRLSTADLCKANGWSVGTVLEGERLPKEPPEMPLPQIQITAIGLQVILAIPMRIAGAERFGGDEQAYSLKTRNWRAVG